MSQYNITNTNKVKRIPERGKYDHESVHAIIDEAKICHVSFVLEGKPMIIPTIMGREENHIYFHGATTSRLLKSLQQGIDVSVCITHLDGLVLARSIFHHSMNYRSAVLFGKAVLVPEEEKIHALKVISDHVIKGRWEEVRQPNEKELKATTVLKMEIDLASAKIRTGPPGDDKEDIDAKVWAGVIPFSLKSQKPICDEFTGECANFPESVSKLLQ